MTTTANISKINLKAGYTIARSEKQMIVRITKPSPRSRFGVKVVANYKFRTIEAMNDYTKRFIQMVQAQATAKEERKNAKKNVVNPYKVGDIFYKSWGYEQTNIDFFQVVAVKGKSIIVREIADKREYSSMQDRGYCTPVKDKFVGEEITKRVSAYINSGNQPQIYVNGLSKYDGTPKYFSQYA